jgi:proteasome lid subunit RPN8/RPN11
MNITPDLLEKITAQATAAYPEECGGLLIGKVERGELVVAAVVPLKNVREDSRHNRIEIDPLAYAKADREATKQGFGVWGFYHSHPNAKAVPSEFDRTHFPFTNWWYPIVEVRNGKAAEIRCWQLSEDRSTFAEIPITSVASS